MPGSRKRYRYRPLRLWPLAAVIVAAGFAGAWVGERHTTGTLTQAAGVNANVAAPAAHTIVAKPAVVEHLLTGGSLLPHTFSPRLNAGAAILVDEASGRVIWGFNPHQRRPVASTTKIMTALLALEKLAPNDIITIDKSVPEVPLVREGLRPGEQVPAWKLFYSLLLYSGNDDARALAIAAGGDLHTFLGEMNAEAARLGMRDTHFVSPSGVIDKDNYSSAWDLAALTRVAMRNSRFRAIVRTQVKHVTWAPPTYSKVYINNNYLLHTYAGANGVKTGYTHLSGPCLVASATRNGISLIAVLLDDPNMYNDATRMLNFGFASLS